jgi:enoyl-CoA hydratase/carnithine racemase
MLNALDTLLTSLAQDDVQVVVFQSSDPRYFCAGADRGRISNPGAKAAMMLESQRVFEKLASSPMVTVAAVEGAAVGGGFEWVLACDLVICGPAARFWFPEVDLGLIPAAGGCTRLQSIVGIKRAKQVILCRTRIAAPLALNWGLVIEISEQPKEAAQDLALKTKSPHSNALAAAKLVLDGGHSTNSSLLLERFAEGMLYEAKLKRQAQIVGFGTALPPHKYTQLEIAKMLSIENPKLKGSNTETFVLILRRRACFP